ncbi:MAG: ATP-binding cassette domain-containing protein [Alphaproteobacteria bacterium]|nr:MAG: ATP-binding cassette domain-containing protein [Alphaproteobacteria bacterium]
MIRADHIGVTFNRGTPLEMRALRDIDITVPTGQFVTVIGSNGAGKSTLLNIFAGELIPDEGRVLVDDRDVTTWPVHRRARMMARMFQDPRSGVCEAMSIIENISIASARTSPRGFRFAINSELRRTAVERLAMLGLGLERRLDDRVSLLSGGQRQALALIMATLGPIRVLLLDEHTAALDTAAAELVLKLTDELVHTLAITTVMVTHSMRQALDYGTRTIMLHQGHVTLDLSGEERSAVTVDELVRLFKRREGIPAAEDELLLG